MRKASAKTIVPVVLLFVVLAALAAVTTYALSLRSRNEATVPSAAPESFAPEEAKALRTAVP